MNASWMGGWVTRRIAIEAQAIAEHYLAPFAISLVGCRMPAPGTQTSSLVTPYRVMGRGRCEHDGLAAFAPMTPMPMRAPR